MLSRSLPALLALAALLTGCRTVDAPREDRPWWEPTLDPHSVPWPLPTGGPLSWETWEYTEEPTVIDYHDAHGAGWWDVPFVAVEQVAWLPCYLIWGLGEVTQTELLMGGYEPDDHDTWQWKVVNYTLGPPYAVISSAVMGVVMVFDTVAHDPVAAVIWHFRNPRGQGEPTG